jgi:hypothetical protein
MKLKLKIYEEKKNLFMLLKLKKKYEQMQNFNMMKNFYIQKY